MFIMLNHILLHLKNEDIITFSHKIILNIFFHRYKHKSFNYLLRNSLYTFNYIFLHLYVY